MKKIVVTPAGRKKYLEVLYNNLKKCRSEFDSWVLWINTIDTSDIEYMVELEKQCDWIELRYSKIPIHSIFSIAHFFEECIDPNSVYIRLDDDIVYIHPNSLKDLFEFRMANTYPFLIYGNVVNNSIVSHFQQRNGNYKEVPPIGYDCMDKNGWHDPIIAEKIHRIFMEKLNNNDAESLFLNNHVIMDFSRFSINVISWLGSEFRKFGGKVGEIEEEWLSRTKPKEWSKPNVIFGKSLFSHYAYFVQRPYLESTDILSKYLEISKEKLKEKRNAMVSEVLKHTIFQDYRGNIYNPIYENHMSPQGCWQFPDELADLLLLLEDKDINSFFNIGTFNGTTFNIISNFLNRNKEVQCITVDVSDFKPQIIEKYKYLRNTSNGFKDQKFDLVFIDGDHSYEAVKLDYENVGKYAKICVFHDIADDFIASNKSLNGGVERFWNEIKKDKKYIEFISPLKTRRIMGIGVLIQE